MPRACRDYGKPGKKPLGGHETPCEHDILREEQAKRKKVLGKASKVRK